MPSSMQRILLWGALCIVVLTIAWVLFRRAANQNDQGFDPVAAAKTILEEARGEGIDLSRGPCLGVISTDWVVDVAHDPRQPVDDNPANQCDAYRTGQATHFVELTPEGKVIRVK